MSRIEQRPLPGGPLSIDLLNTAWNRKGQHFDWLTNDDAVVEFADFHNVAITSGEIVGAREALVDSRGLIQRLFTADHIDDQLASEVNDVLASAKPILAVVYDLPRIEISASDPERKLALNALVNAIGLLDDQANRIKSCQQEDCTLWFLDISKAGRRRWCSMERCGNREKARRHHRRTRASD